MPEDEFEFDGLSPFFSLSLWERVGVRDPNVIDALIWMETLNRPSATFSRREKGRIEAIKQVRGGRLA